jgi:hypothetical protein
MGVQYYGEKRAELAGAQKLIKTFYSKLIAFHPEAGNEAFTLGS